MPLILTIYPADFPPDRRDAEGFEVDAFELARAACPFDILAEWRGGDPDGHGYIMLESGLAASLSVESFDTLRAACTAAVSALRQHGEAITLLRATDAVQGMTLVLEVSGARPADSPSGSPPRFPPPLIGLARGLGLTLLASFREGWSVQWPPSG